VALVNETSSPLITEDYRTVLNQMGYKVVSAGQRPPQGPPGETVVAYGAGKRAQAAALARRLPGRRSLMPSSGIEADAVVVIR
jgi:hypothetical protein